MERKQLTKAQKQKIGTRCINCGTEEGIEYHHVVPLLLGGNDILENIVPLCHSCHKTAHCGQHISHYVKLRILEENQKRHLRNQRKRLIYTFAEQLEIGRYVKS